MSPPPTTTLPITGSTQSFSLSSDPRPPPNNDELDRGLNPSRPPISSTPVGLSSDDASLSHVHSAATSRTPTPTSPFPSNVSTSVISKENRRTSTSTITRPPPILKKEGSSGSSRSSRAVRTSDPHLRQQTSGNVAENEDYVSPVDEPDLVSGRSLAPPRRQTNTRFNEEVAVSIPKPLAGGKGGAGERLSRSGGESTQRSSRKPPPVVASSGISKRPVAMRQRSATGSPKDVPSRNASYQILARSPKPLKATEDSSDARRSSRSNPKETKRSRAASPHPSKQHMRSSPDSRNVSRGTESEPSPEHEASAELTSSTAKNMTISRVASGKQPEATKPLVDPNFRSKFIQRAQSSQRSFTDLSLLSQKSSAAVPTAASYNATGILEEAQSMFPAARGLGRTDFTNVTAPLKAPAPAGPEITNTNYEAPGHSLWVRSQVKARPGEEGEEEEEEETAAVAAARLQANLRKTDE